MLNCLLLFTVALNSITHHIIKNIDKFNHVSGNDIVAQIVIYSRNTAINL